MIKLLLIMIMMFTFGTSTINAVEDTTNIEDRIDELAEIESANQSTIKAKIDELSEGELKAVIANINELTEPTEEDLAIKEVAVSKLEEMKEVEALSPLNIGKPTLNIGKPILLSFWMGVLAICLIFSAGVMLLTGFNEESKYPLILGLLALLIMVASL